MSDVAIIILSSVNEIYSTDRQIATTQTSSSVDLSASILLHSAVLIDAIHQHVRDPS